MSSTSTITSARIDPSRDPFGENGKIQADVYVTVDGKEKKLFSFYDDELCFTTDEFIGITEEEGHALFVKKDVAYLRS